MKNIPDKVLKVVFPKTGSGITESETEKSEFENKIIASFKLPPNREKPISYP